MAIDPPGLVAFPFGDAMRIHLIAVGGTGMGSLAGLLKAQGHEVSGCDGHLYPPMSETLLKYGIDSLEGHDPSHLVPRPDLVVVGNACHKDNPECVACIDEGIPYLSMAEAIRRFALEGRKSLVVSGTHGKTSTTALCGYLLEQAGLKPNMIVGGIARDFDASFLWGGGEWTVVEGDEYETAYFDKGPKFLHYRPDLLILNNIEMDHLDNFKDLAELENAFVRLFGVVSEDGLVLAGTESESVRRLLPLIGRRTLPFGLEIPDAGGLTAADVHYGQEGTWFRLLEGKVDWGPFLSPLYGAHNLRNTIAALGAALQAGAEIEALRECLPGFRGVKRRQEVVAEAKGIVVVDDFGHHPTAIRETLRALIQRFEPKRVVACFEPRSFTCQTDTHQETLPGAFHGADVVLLGPLKAHSKIPTEKRLDLDRVARELNDSGVSSVVMDDAEAYLSWMSEELAEGDLVAFFSSGSFSSLPKRTGEILEGRGGSR